LPTLPSRPEASLRGFAVHIQRMPPATLVTHPPLSQACASAAAAALLPRPCLEGTRAQAPTRPSACSAVTGPRRGTRTTTSLYQTRSFWTFGMPSPGMAASPCLTFPPSRRGCTRPRTSITGRIPPSFISATTVALRLAPSSLEPTTGGCYPGTRRAASLTSTAMCTQVGMRST